MCHVIDEVSGREFQEKSVKKRMSKRERLTGHIMTERE